MTPKTQREIAKAKHHNDTMIKKILAASEMAKNKQVQYYIDSGVEACQNNINIINYYKDGVLLNEK